MVLQAFIDESAEEGGVFVLGGCIASPASWAAFTQEWKELLPSFGVLGSDGRYRFKMAEMAALAERMDRVQAFYRVIEKHITGFVSCKIDASELERAKSRIVVPGTILEWGRFHPYMVAFRYLIDKFHIERPNFQPWISLGEKIDFYFDETSDKRAIISFWADYMSGRQDAIREFYGAMPRFEDDNDFLPLQAADFWVWWVRKWYLEGTPEKILHRDFGVFQRQPVRENLVIEIVINEADLIKNMVEMVRKRLPPDKPILVLD